MKIVFAISLFVPLVALSAGFLFPQIPLPPLPPIPLPQLPPIPLPQLPPIPLPQIPPIPLPKIPIIPWPQIPIPPIVLPPLPPLPSIADIPIVKNVIGAFKTTVDTVNTKVAEFQQEIAHLMDEANKHPDDTNAIVNDLGNVVGVAISAIKPATEVGSGVLEIIKGAQTKDGSAIASGVIDIVKASVPLIGDVLKSSNAVLDAAEHVIKLDQYDDPQKQNDALLNTLKNSAQELQGIIKSIEDFCQCT